MSIGVCVRPHLLAAATARGMALSLGAHSRAGRALAFAMRWAAPPDPARWQLRARASSGAAANQVSAFASRAAHRQARREVHRAQPDHARQRPRVPPGVYPAVARPALRPASNRQRLLGPLPALAAGRRARHQVPQASPRAAAGSHTHKFRPPAPRGSGTCIGLTSSRFMVTTAECCCLARSFFSRVNPCTANGAIENMPEYGTRRGHNRTSRPLLLAVALAVGAICCTPAVQAAVPAAVPAKLSGAGGCEQGRARSLFQNPDSSSRLPAVRPPARPAHQSCNSAARLAPPPHRRRQSAACPLRRRRLPRPWSITSTCWTASPTGVLACGLAVGPHAGPALPRARCPA